MNRILVTGASGFIGRAVVEKLIADSDMNIEIHCVCNKSVTALFNNVIWHQCDLLDSKAREHLFETVQPNRLIHLAWCSDHGSYWKSLDNLEWLKSSIDLVKLFVKFKGERCVFIGTSAEYDWSGSDPLNEETSLFNPKALYGSCKYSLYLIISRYFREEGISWAWARLFNSYGPYEHPQRLIPKTCAALLRNQPLKFDSASSFRDFLHVEDVASGIVDTLNGTINGPVNIGSGFPTEIREVITSIAKYYNKLDLLSFDNSEISVSENYVVANNNKLIEDFGWKPSKSLQQGLNETCDWWANKIIT